MPLLLRVITFFGLLHGAALATVTAMNSAGWLANPLPQRPLLEGLIALFLYVCAFASLYFLPRFFPAAVGEGEA